MQTAISYLDFSRHSQRGDNIGTIEKVNAKDTLIRPINSGTKNRPDKKVYDIGVEAYKNCGRVNSGPKIKPDGRLSKYPEVPQNGPKVDTSTMESQLSDIKAQLKSHDEMIKKIVALLEKDINIDEPLISPEALALILTELESGEKQVDIAQMKEVVKVMPEAFSQFSDSQIIKFIRGMK